MVTAEPQLHLRWHSHSATFTSMLSELHDSAPYSDVELCCNDGRVQAHRAVLSLCSPFLANVLSSLGSSSPTESFLPGSGGGRVRMVLPDVPVQDVQYLVSFIYCGQVDVPQAHIASFLNTGKHLHVLGLEQGDRLVASPEPSEGSNSSCPPSDVEEDAPSCPSRASSCASRPLSRSSTPHSIHSQSDGGQSSASVSSTASSSLLMTLQSQQLNQAVLQQLHQQQLHAAAGQGAKDVSDVNANLTPQKGLLMADNSARQNISHGRGMKNEIKLKQEAMDEDKELPLNPQVFIKEEKKTDRDDEDEDTSLTLKHSVFSNTHTSRNNNLYNNNTTTTTTTTSDPVSGAAVTCAASDSSDTSSGGTSYGEEGGVGFPNVGCIIGSDGRIDLNYYLQQAIQCASMPCPLCKKEFKSQSGLRDHIRLHTGERPFICEFCHMNFARASHLKRHRRMHTGEKPFECRVCGKDFSRGDKLKDHLKRHEAEEKLNKIRKQIFTPEDCSSDTPSGLAVMTSSLMSAGANGSQVSRGGEPIPGGVLVNGDCGVGGVKTSSSLTIAAAAATSDLVGGTTNSVLSVGDTLSSIGERMANLVARANPQAVTPDSVMSAKTAVSTTTAATVAASIQQQIQQHQLQQMQQQQQHNLQQQAQLLQQQQLALQQQSTEQMLRRPSLPLPNSKKRKTQHTVSSTSNNKVMTTLSSSSAAATTINMITPAASRLNNSMPSVSNYSSLANNITSSISSSSSASNNINSINSIASLNSLMQSVTSNGSLSISAGGFHQLQSGGGVSTSTTNQGSANTSSNNSSSGITPQMLGIASIGECILRPIN